MADLSGAPGETRLIGLIDDYAIMCVPLGEMCPIEQQIAGERWNNLPYADRVALGRYRDWRAKQAALQAEPEPERLPDLPDLEDGIDPLLWLTGSDQGFDYGSSDVSPIDGRRGRGMALILVLSLLCWIVIIGVCTAMRFGR